MKPRVAVLGGGMAAAYVVAVCRDSGIAPDVFSSSVVTQVGGAFWLYWIPRGNSSPPYTIRVSGMGSADEYSRAQWGEMYPSSFPQLPYVTHGYDPRAVLPELWRNTSIELRAFATDLDVQALAEKYDLVFQTFSTQKAKEHQPTPKLMYVCVQRLSTPVQEGWVLYNGQPGAATWVRQSALFDCLSTECVECSPTCEIGHGKSRTHPKLHPLTNPWLESPAPNVVLVGRFAEWNRTRLAHHCYALAQEALASLGVV